MFDIFSYIMPFLFCMSLNLIFVRRIDKITKYKNTFLDLFDDWKLTILILVFGPIMFFFLKQIRVYRKHKYLKDKIIYYQWHCDSKGHNWFFDDAFDNTLKKLERIYKISKLHQKTKRNKLKKKLFTW